VGETDLVQADAVGRRVEDVAELRVVLGEPSARA
jgi:hypothetical protein